MLAVVAEVANAGQKITPMPAYRIVSVPPTPR